MQNAVDFELTLRGFSGIYLAEITIDRGADSTTHAGPFEVAFDLLQLQEELLASPEQYGKHLTGMLFAADGMREALAEARGMASAQRTHLRLRLVLGAGAEALHAQHWELLYLPGRDERLCTREDILFSRYLPVGTAALPPAPKTALRALAAIASPSNAEAFGLAKVELSLEVARAQTGLAGMEIDWLPAEEREPCTLDRLVSRVPGHEVLYLVCHGKMGGDQGWLFLQEENGQAARISAQVLVKRLAGTLSLPRLAVLVMCESAGNDHGAFFGSLAPGLVEVGIPAVIAMQSALTFQSADLFLPALFRELQKDGMIDRAASVARRSIIGRPDEHAPVLFLGLKSGLLWSSPAREAVPAHPVRPSPSAGGSGQVVDQVKLYQILNSDIFTLEDLENLCFTLNVDWEQLRGGVKPAKARAMIQFFHSRGRTAELVEAIRAERPHLEL